MRLHDDVLRTRAVLNGASAIALMAAVAAGGPALAQSSSDSATSLDEVVVTGSRIARSGTTPIPVTVVSEEDVTKLGLTNTAQIVSQLPQNSNYVSPTNQGRQTINLGLNIANLRGLSPYRGTRTLTLVDSRRHVPTSNSGAVDLNVVPSMLIQRVETVTGGASAAYGSDAVVGVINLILDTKLEGFKAQVDYGVAGEGDGAEKHVSAAGGMAFAGGRGHVVGGGEYQLSDTIDDCAAARDWCAEGYGLFTSLNRQFNATGTAVGPFVPGAFANPASFGAQMQGGADASQDLQRGTPIRPETERYGLFAHVDYEITDWLDGYAEASWSQRTAHQETPSSGAPFGTLIRPDNAYLPASVRPLITAPQLFVSNNPSLPERNITAEAEVYRFLFGLKGDLGSKWKWDAYYTYGENKNTERQRNIRYSPFFNFAIDAVDNPATAAFDPACRATLPGPGFNPAAAGCLPLNLFGLNNFNPAAYNYAFRTLHQDETYKQQVAALTIQGELFDAWGAGPINVAGGAEYRYESLKNDHHIRQNPWYWDGEVSLGPDFSGTAKVAEAFAEVSVPILTDTAIAKSLVVDGAVRFTRNTNEDKFTGKERTIEFTTWKLSGVWDVNDWVRLRATRSHDARVPSFFERFGAQVAVGGQNASPQNPWAGNAFQPVFGVLGTASPDLHEEKADTWTAGVVFNGQGRLGGLFASADWYEIEIDGPIQTFGSVQNAVNACFNDGAACDQLQGIGPVGRGYAVLTQVTIPFRNLGKYTTRGIDLEAGYRLDLGDSQSLTFRGIGSYVYHLLIDPGTGAPTRNYAGISGPTALFGYFNTSPKWQANLMATYENDRFSGTVQARYVGPGKYALLSPLGLPFVSPGDAGYSTTNPASLSNNEVDSRIYFNVSATYRIMEDKPNLEVFGSINNLLDTDPPNIPNNPVYFDPIGRYFRIGARMRY